MSKTPAATPAITREDLTVLWAITQDGFTVPGKRSEVYINGRVFHNTAPALSEPALLVDTRKAKADTVNETVGSLIARAEAELELYLADINGPSTAPDVNVMRERLGLPSKQEPIPAAVAA